ncbi:importin-8 [Ditylenchus destructor]|nr:importin-8 [Ditylenchus destructor]
MEIQTIKEALRATTVAENQQHASEYLKESSKMIGFSQILFDLATSNDDSVEYAVRQAAIIYLKNLVHKSWVVDEDDKELPLSEQDKTPIRRRIISAIVNAPEPIRIHLCSCVQYIMRNDFPKDWPGLLDELVTLLHTPNGAELLGALLVILRLCKVYEYKNQEEKAPLMEVMKHILPLLQQRLTSLLTDAQCNSQASCLLQKMILKIFFCLVQFSLNTEAIPVEAFSGWIKLFLAIIERGIPPECEELETESMEDTIWWKCKKWALRIISRVFERYGSKGQFAVPVIDAILKHVLTDYANKKFVSNWVLFLAVGHLAEALSQAQIWIVVKPHFQELLRCVIFPLLSHTEEDEQIWDDDPQEYLRCKYDTFIGKFPILCLKNIPPL